MTEARAFLQPSRLGLFALAPVSLILYLLSFPSVLLPAGAGFASTFALAPIFAAAMAMRPSRAFALGLAFGGLAYAGLSHWLYVYHPGALLLSIAIAALWFGAAFSAMSATRALPPTLRFCAAALIWAACEIGRSSGTLAFPYGTLPYALYERRLALDFASVLGTAGLSLALACLNLALAYALPPLFEAVRPGRAASGLRKAAPFLGPWLLAVTALALAGKPRQDGSLAAWALANGQEAGLSSLAANPPAAGAYRVALIQPNARGQQGGAEDYRASFLRLADLSREALPHAPNLVAWHETAIIPAIDWHRRYRPDRATYEFIGELDAFLRDYPVPLLIGNGYSDPADPEQRLRQNSALLYEGGVLTDRYAKAKLVPFSESDPLNGAWPRLSSYLTMRFGHFWTEGDGPGVMDAGGARIAAPICFEDSFGAYLASFDNPDAFIVLTDDSWGRSAALQNQHLAMSAFRAAECASVVLRASADGATAAIAPSGAVVGRLPPFSQGVLMAEFPPSGGRTTAYEAWGHAAAPALLFLGALSALLAWACAIAAGFRARGRR